MSLWEILVLGAVLLTLDTNYDRLEHISNYDILARELLGVSTFGSHGKRYPLQTIKDNVSLLTDEMLNEINELVAKEGHHGLNRCPAKSLEHFKRYVALGVLSFNLHRLGNVLIENDRKNIKRKRHRKLKAA